jgi:hypothetical protein
LLQSATGVASADPRVSAYQNFGSTSFCAGASSLVIVTDRVPAHAKNAAHARLARDDRPPALHQSRARTSWAARHNAASAPEALDNRCASGSNLARRSDPTAAEFLVDGRK